MSRSYKHTPRCGDTKDRFMKKYANRKIRRMDTEYFLQHKSYKKIICSYDICDYESVGTSFEEYWEIIQTRWYSRRKDQTREEAYRDWYRWFKAK